MTTMTSHHMSYLEATAESMEPGTRERIICPKCGGGQSKEKSLSLFKDHETRLAWKCFRANCGYSGAPKGVSGTSSKASSPRYYTGDLMNMFIKTDDLSVSVYDNHALFLIERFGINVRLIKWSYDLRRYMLPIMSPDNKLRGYVAYSFADTPKSLTYRERVDEPFMHHVWPDNVHSYTVIVEDWFSAQKVADAGFKSIALLGTVLNRERVDEIKEASRGTQTVLALDNDAYAKAIKYVLEYGDEFDPPMRVGRLKQDLKYVDKEVIKAVLDADGTDFTGSNFKGSKLL